MNNKLLSYTKTIVLCLSLLIVLYYTYKYLKTEGFVVNGSNTVKFLQKEETADFLEGDLDFYSRSLSQWDLIARHVSSEEEYRIKSINSAITFTESDKRTLQAVAVEADNFFKNINFDGLDCAKMAIIPWIFALTSGKDYEDGLPHTRADIIFLSKDTVNFDNKKELLKTLVHEKIHIYQRKYPEEMVNYLESNGYTQWKQRFGVPRIRANPDLDPWIYYDPITSKPMLAYYTSDRPYNITDIGLTDASFEHPFELIAYRVASKL